MCRARSDHNRHPPPRTIVRHNSVGYFHDDVEGRPEHSPFPSMGTAETMTTTDTRWRRPNREFSEWARIRGPR